MKPRRLHVHHFQEDKYSPTARLSPVQSAETSLRLHLKHAKHHRRHSMQILDAILLQSEVMPTVPKIAHRTRYPPFHCLPTELPTPSCGEAGLLDKYHNIFLQSRVPHVAAF